MNVRAPLVLLVLLLAGPARAQDSTRLTFHLEPTKRVQLAIWLESPVAPFQTVLLTYSVSKYGIGNRPGALEMNSGFQWPYGRREGALPVWAHRRVEIGGEAPFPRVIFRNRAEGAASVAPIDRTDPYSDNPDPYFCLSFTLERMASAHTRDALDAMACPSRYMSDRGRYLTDGDVAGGYSEPYVRADGTATTYPLTRSSLYPPRRDIAVCTDGPPTCLNHPDTNRYAADAIAAMPELDAVSQPTLPDTMVSAIQFTMPGGSPAGHYVAYVEANTEGDYNATYNETTYPTPTTPDGLWDYYAPINGYPYRGQPSVVYRLDFDLPTTDPMMDVVQTSAPIGHGSVDGRGGADATMYDMSDGTMTLDTPGSGAQRLLPIAADGSRVRLEVRSPMYCVGATEPSAITGLAARSVPEDAHSHEWGQLSFTVPEADRPITGYDVRVSTQPITDEASFSGAGSVAVRAYAATLDDIALVVPTGGTPGSAVSIDFGHLSPVTHYWLGIRASTDCKSGPVAVTQFDTTAIHFTTVSPCFVATAAYGTPVAGEIGALRRFRDRHLESNAVGRTLVVAYYSEGPRLATIVREHPVAGRVVRALLRPVVAAARALDD